MSKILIYGSTYLTEICCLALMDAGHELCGYVPNRDSPVVPGYMPIPEVTRQDVRPGLILSIQYDRRILTDLPAYNVHTGLLPQWGGSDILYHTLRLGAREQGATFHGVTPVFDCGPIVAKVTYPVLPGDTMLDLYDRLITLLPSFVVSSLELVFHLGVRVADCPAPVPRLFQRGQIDPRDADLYAEMPILLRQKVKRGLCIPTS